MTGGFASIHATEMQHRFISPLISSALLYLSTVRTNVVFGNGAGTLVRFVFVTYILCEMRL